MANLLELTGQSVESLNQKLEDQLSSPLDQDLYLSLQTPNWSITEITAKTSASRADQISCSMYVEGASTNGVAIFDNNSQTYNIQYRLFWQDSIIPELINLAIHPGANCKIIKISASEHISPWQLMKTIRKDVPMKNCDDALQWACIHGFQEYNYLHQDEEAIHSLNQLIGTIQKHRRFECYLWNARSDVQSSFSTINNPDFGRWVSNHSHEDHRLPIRPRKNILEIRSPNSKLWSQRMFGVNLFGYYSEALGIGEDCRTAHAALEMAGIPTKINDIPTKQCPKELKQAFLDQPDDVAPFAFNLFCMNCEEHARILLELGKGVSANRYNIGYWPWELERWPKQWRPMISLVDEIWSSSLHTYNSLEPEIKFRSRPALQHLPLSVIADKPQSQQEKAKWRQLFNINTDTVVFICSFDGRSGFWRKNPWGSVKAFQLAFPTNQQSPEVAQNNVQLVIKCMHGKIDQNALRELGRICASDSRILLINSKLSRENLLGLYGCCDALISLHRAEGFGRNLAEAFLAGLDVIATNYSGNLDFCDGPLYHPINFKKTELLRSHYPHGEGQIWAEPSLHDAAIAMQKVYQKRSKSLATTSSLHRDRETYRERFSIQRIGRLYAERLEQIWSKRKSLEETLYWQDNQN